MAMFIVTTHVEADSMSNATLALFNEDGELPAEVKYLEIKAA